MTSFPEEWSPKMSSNWIISRAYPDLTLAVTASLLFSMSIYILECQRPSYFNTVSWLLSIMFGLSLLGSFFELPLNLWQAVLKGLSFSCRISPTVTHRQDRCFQNSGSHCCVKRAHKHLRLTLLKADAYSLPTYFSELLLFLISCLHLKVSGSWDHLLLQLKHSL